MLVLGLAVRVIIRERGGVQGVGAGGEGQGEGKHSLFFIQSPFCRFARPCLW